MRTLTQIDAFLTATSQGIKGAVLLPEIIQSSAFIVSSTTSTK